MDNKQYVTIAVDYKLIGGLDEEPKKKKKDKDDAKVPINIEDVDGLDYITE